MPKLVLKNLSKKFGDKTVLSDFNLTVKEGEFVVLVGPSGSGKSTILRLISGLEKESAGEIWIEERMVNSVPPKDRDVAMVFQNYALYPHMSVFDNIAFPLKLRKLAKPEIQSNVERVAKLVGLEEFLPRKPATLSGGQRQRVALGRAIIRQPKLFLFDEPLSNLDAQMRTNLRAELLRLHRTLKATSIYVTHDQQEAMTLGDKVIVLKDGVAQQEGSPMELYHKPANKFVAQFIGSPGMNLLTGKVFKSDKLYFDQDLKIPLEDSSLEKYANQELILGIRPEDLVLNPGGSAGSISSTIEYTEPAGGESFLYLSAGDFKLTAIFAGVNQFQSGQKVGLGF
ncbi:MAG: ABC transporter ATP-binding protein [candidate division Zixibacteria bacterium]|nr:ABC transporter ATP-binding protein [candidate division Zixibacteria bacterium]